MRAAFLNASDAPSRRSWPVRIQRLCSKGASGLVLLVCLLRSETAAWAEDGTATKLVINQISVQLDSSGLHTLTLAEIDKIVAGSRDRFGVTNVTVLPQTFCFCDCGIHPINVSLVNSLGVVTNGTGSILVLRPPPPQVVYVNSAYRSDCGSVEFLEQGSASRHWIGFDAFSTIQQAVDQVVSDGLVKIAAGTYQENVVVARPVSLLGPNAGIPGQSAARGAEARVIPRYSDPENAPIISVESDDVIVDGLFLDGGNALLAGGYNANGIFVHAAAGIQNGTYPDLADIEGVTIRNNVITNISYDGICLDRYQYFGTSSAWNYIRHNKLANMWEGILTYAVDSVIVNNEVTNVTHGIGVHCVTTRAPREFSPLIASNILSIAQWWPVEIQADRAPGIWVNFRQEQASPILVVGNTISTPVAAPSAKTIIGLYALTVSDDRKVAFTDNIVSGCGNCTVGFLASNCESNECVTISQGALRDIRGKGVLVQTVDSKWGPGDCSVTVSNVLIHVGPDGAGIAAIQETPTNRSFVVITGGTKIEGGLCGIQVCGPKAAARIFGGEQHICDNQVGVYVENGRALLEGSILTNNQVAAVEVLGQGVVDAGDCYGRNISGIGGGSGANGASAGLNDFSGYGFDGIAPWAISNRGIVPVTADGNIFKANAGEQIEDSIAGAVQFSEASTLEVIAPPALGVQCFRDIPPAASTVAEFVSAGGQVISGAPSNVTCRDVIVTNRAGDYSVRRTYTLAGGCARPVSCEQIILAQDNQAPILQCSGNIVQGVDPGQDYASVTFTNVAADGCGELLGSWLPVSTGQFAVGTNHMIVIASDLANNVSVCSFDIAVIPPPVITLQPLSRTNVAGTRALFTVSATSPAPLTFAWKKDGVLLTPKDHPGGISTAELTLDGVSALDEGVYSVEVANLAGTISSAGARLTVITAPPTLYILGVADGVAKLEVKGPTNSRFGLLTSTNLKDWVGLRTNWVPFVLPHTNPSGVGYRFYRALPVP